MNKKIILLGVVVLLLVAVAVPAAYADITSSQQKSINDIYNKIAENQKQLIQQYVDAGQITPQQADLAKQRIDLMNQYRTNPTVTSNVYGPGLGCWGGGPGYCGSPGFCGRGGWGSGWTGSWGSRW